MTSPEPYNLYPEHDRPPEFESGRYDGMSESAIEQQHQADLAAIDAYYDRRLAAINARHSRDFPAAHPTPAAEQPEWEPDGTMQAPAEASERRLSAKQRRVVSVAAGIAGAAALAISVPVIVSSAESSSTSTAADPADSPTIERGKRSADTAIFSSQVTEDDAVSLESARQKIPHIAAGNPKVSVDFQMAMDYATARAFIKAPLSPRSPTDAISADSITSIPLREKAGVIKYTLNASQVKSSLYTDAPLAEKRNELTATAPAGAERVRDDAVLDLEKTYAEKALGSGFTSEEDVAAAKKKIEEVSNPQVKADALRLLDIANGVRITTDVGIKDLTPEQADPQIAQLQDPQLRGRVSEAVHIPADEYGYRSETLDFKTRLSLEYYDALNSKLDPYDSPFKDDQQTAQHEQLTITQDARAKLTAANETYGEVVASENSLSHPIEAPESFPAITGGQSELDLSDVDTETVPNVAYELIKESRDEQSKRNNPEEFEQFGEISMKEGKMDIAYDSSLSDALRGQFAQAIERSRPTLEAAFANGTLTSVRLVMGSSYDPRYVPGSREIIISLAEDDHLSQDQLDAGLLHESTHALYRDFFHNLTIDDADKTALINVCRDLRISTYDDLTVLFSVNTTDLDSIRAAMKPEHQPMIDKFREAIANKQLGTILTPDYSSTQTPAINHCDDLGEVSTFMGGLAQGIKGLESFQISNLTYLNDNPAYVEFVKTLNRHFEYGTVFSQLVNESNYTETKSMTKNDLGHSQDNASELFASLFDAMVNYGPQFKIKLDALQDEEQALIRRTVNIMVSYGQKNSPSLAPLLGYLRTQYGSN